jgi:hypothetical protein
LGRRAKAQAVLYPSLRYLSISSLQTAVLHPILSTICNNVGDVYKGMIKVCLATGTYYLHSKRKSTKEIHADKTCPLCKLNYVQTREHFLFVCIALQKTRVKAIAKCLVQMPDETNQAVQLRY